MKLLNWFLVGVGAVCLSTAVALVPYVGVPVEPAVVADFNNDGKQDILYSTSANLNSRGDDCLSFVDGNDLTKNNGKYKRHCRGRLLFDGPRGPDAGNSDIVAGDINNDGNIDISLFQKSLSQDSMLYMMAKKYYIGDGHGNFRLVKGAE